MAKLSRHANIPIFIPHLGCPNDCVFCDQRTISGVGEFSMDGVVDTIEDALKTIEGTGRVAEIAFFGGSFTGIDRELMIALLDTAEEYVRRGVVSGIRMSTRPDYISEEIIDIISRYTLSEVELGIQSMSDEVLALSRRGHSADDTRRACEMLTDAKISFVGQMMIGLPGSTVEDEIHCAEEICALGAVGCRIYPTIVFKGTCLAKMTEMGQYIPLDVDEAVSRSASVLEVFERHDVKLLRIGLQDSEALHSEDKILAGPVHPAIGELVRGELFYRRLRKTLESMSDRREELIVEVPRTCASAVVGVNGINRERLMKAFGLKRLKVVESSDYTGFNVALREMPQRKNKEK